MATKSKDVTFRLKLLEWKQFAEGANAGGKAIKHLGAEAETAGKKAGASARGWGIYSKQTETARRHSDAARLSVGKLAKSAGGLALAFGAVSSAKEAIHTTEELGRATANLSTIQGLSGSMAAKLALIFQAQGLSQSTLAQNLNMFASNSVKADQQWAKSSAKRVQVSRATQAQLVGAQQAYSRKIAVLGNSAKDRVRGQQDLEQYQQRVAAIRALGAAHAAAAKGVGSAADAYKKLGITQAQVHAGKTDSTALFNLVGTKLSQMPPGFDKAAIGKALFGKGAQTMLTQFKTGPDSFANKLKWARDAGAPASLSGAEQQKELAVMDHAKIAMAGLQFQAGKALLPALIGVAKVFPRVIASIKKGDGIWGPLKTMVGGAAHALAAIVGWFDRSKIAAKALGYGLGLLAAGWGIEKVVGFGKAIKNSWVVLKGFRYAVIGLDAALTANPIGAAVVAVVALGAAFYVAYKKVDWFRAGVQDTWSWIKRHWGLLAGPLIGPFGVATVFISRHLDQIVGFVSRMPARIGQVAKGMWTGLRAGLVATLNWIIRKWDSLADIAKAPGWVPLIGGKHIVPHIDQIPVPQAGGHRHSTSGGGRTPVLGGAPSRLTGSDHLLRLPKTTHARSVGTGGQPERREVVIHNYIHLDGKQVATSVAKRFVEMRARA